MRLVVLVDLVVRFCGIGLPSSSKADLYIKTEPLANKIYVFFLLDQLHMIITLIPTFNEMSIMSKLIFHARCLPTLDCY